jgi:hypothetical protein
VSQLVRSAAVWSRILFSALGVAAIALFAALFVLSQFGGAPVLHGAFSAGLVPALLATYFWLYRRDQRAFNLGIIAVLVATAVHYVVFAVTAHASTFTAVVAVVIECAIGLAIITTAHRRFRYKVAL